MNAVELEVKGMTCGSCVSHVKSALQSVPGVTQVEVSLASGRARVEGDFKGSAPLIAALDSANYEAIVAQGDVSAEIPNKTGCKSGRGNSGGCCCG